MYPLILSCSSAYTGHGTGFEGIKKSNVVILENAVQAVENLCPNLLFWTFQTGRKVLIFLLSNLPSEELYKEHGPLQWYGFDFADKIGVLKPPNKESNPRIPDPYASSIMYYAQYDALQKLSKDKKWSFAEIRPDGIVSHTLS